MPEQRGRGPWQRLVAPLGGGVESGWCEIGIPTPVGPFFIRIPPFFAGLLRARFGLVEPAVALRDEALVLVEMADARAIIGYLIEDRQDDSWLRLVWAGRHVAERIRRSAVRRLSAITWWGTTGPPTALARGPDDAAELVDLRRKLAQIKAITGEKSS
jgi:hypothetical protein